MPWRVANYGIQIMVVLCVDFVTTKQNMIGMLRSAQEQILFFSGNLSWANLKQGDKEVIDVLEEIAAKDIPLKFLGRVDITSLKNIQKLIAINQRIGKERVEIRHCEQPVRAIIIDDKKAQFKEIKYPEDYNREELDKKTYIFYEIYDKEWIEWIRKVFWNLFRKSVPASKRIKDLNTIQNIVKL